MDAARARATDALVSAWPGRTPGVCGARAKPVAARSACNSRASKHVGIDMARGSHAPEGSRARGSAWEVLPESAGAWEDLPARGSAWITMEARGSA
jgi:hypothetical protein